MKDLLTKSTKCLLIQPGFSDEGYMNFSDIAGFIDAKYTVAPLGLMTVAALFPQHWEFRLIDENVEPLADADFEWADIVLTGGMLPQQKRILATIKKAQDMGKPVAVGGPDPTSQPHIYETADFLVLGEGEITIPLFLEDLGKGATSGVYEPDNFADMAQSAVPRFDLVRLSDYTRVDIQYTRGCPHNCEFCDIIELFGRKLRYKTIDQILAELDLLRDLGYRGHINFVDDNFIGSRERAIAVLKAMKDWSERNKYPFYFSTNTTTSLAKEKEILALMRENDFRIIFFGIESPDENVLIQTQKRQNTLIPVAEAVKIASENGMIVIGGFIIGFDDENEHTAQKMIELIQETGICMAYVGLLFALPNTQLSNRLEREGRHFGNGQVMMDSTMVDQMTSGLNFATVRPRAEVLQDYVDVIRHAYDPKNFYTRVLHTTTNLVPRHKHHPNLKQILKMAKAFFRVSARAGFAGDTRALYWKTLFKVLIKNPKAAYLVVWYAAIYIHFARNKEMIIRRHEETIEHINDVGEERYNEMMLGTQAIQA